MLKTLGGWSKYRSGKNTPLIIMSKHVYDWEYAKHNYCSCGSMQLFEFHLIFFHHIKAIKSRVDLKVTSPNVSSFYL